MLIFPPFSLRITLSGRLNVRVHLPPSSHRPLTAVVSTGQFPPGFFHPNIFPSGTVCLRSSSATHPPYPLFSLATTGAAEKPPVDPSLISRSSHLPRLQHLERRGRLAAGHQHAADFNRHTGHLAINAPNVFVRHLFILFAGPFGLPQPQRSRPGARVQVLFPYISQPLFPYISQPPLLLP